MGNNGEVFGAYDIRGVVGQGFDEHFALRLGRAVAAFLCPQHRGRFLVGRDARDTSPALARALVYGLTEAGHEVVDIGMASTPLVYWYGASERFDGSVAVTASHLGPEHNGFKISRRDAVPVSSADGLKEIRSLLAVESCPAIDAPGETTMAEPLQSYVAHMKSLLRVERTVRIGVDAGGGACGPEVERLLGAADGVELVGLGLVPDGTGRERHPNPLEDGALDRLSAAVLEQGCAFGVSLDGDGDRAIVVDERGRMVPPDLVTALVGRRFSQEEPGAGIMYDLRSSRAVPEAIAAAGGKPLRTRVGHSFIKAAMRQYGAAFAGELSGHYYYRDLYYTDNALRTIVELVNVQAGSNVPFSQQVQPLETYSLSGEMNFKASEAEAVLARLKSEFSGGTLDELDGVSVDFPDWWFNARISKTEGVVRVTMGAITEDLLQERRVHLVGLVESASRAACST